ncbi:MAG TPA: apolipoprotein N-acyltransferase [Candidatus Aquilonibacter sp.]
MRTISTSVFVRDAALAALGGVALALAFPKFDAVWLAPFGTAALFFAWKGASWNRAFWLGWFGGAIFFGITFSWFGYTAGSYLGALAPILVIGPALIEGFFFAVAGMATAIAFARAPAWAAPLAAAAAFTAADWLRSIGPIGAPFAQLGYTQAQTPLAVFAAYVGTYGITFLLCAVGAYLADAIARRTVTPLATTVGAIVVAWIACFSWWPARHAAAPTMRVAAVQGNIRQSLKFQPGQVAFGIDRYEQMTRTLRTFHAQLVVWPETVVAEPLNQDDATVAALQRLAGSLETTLAVGAQDTSDRRWHNAIYVFGPAGSPPSLYYKRALVPFAEAVPLRSALAYLPYVASMGGNFAAGSVDAVFPTDGLRFAPLICWESAFADLAYAQVRDGAQLLVVSTDDAWFGDTAGPYQHAQIAQLRAIEDGVWVVRAAATGISGIIAPDGRYVARSALDTQTIVTGLVGSPPGSPFAHFGPTPVALTLAALYFVLVVPRWRDRVA